MFEKRKNEEDARTHSTHGGYLHLESCVYGVFSTIQIVLTQMCDWFVE